LLPQADVFVTNAGAGGVGGAVPRVPMAIGAGSEEKPEVAARVEYRGA
jgi:UDP:flavonoid glycosyltransferase YjiC (YdhE family)